MINHYQCRKESRQSGVAEEMFMQVMEAREKKFAVNYPKTLTSIGILAFTEKKLAEQFKL
jgi:hypothetical protein